MPDAPAQRPITWQLFHSCSPASSNRVLHSVVAIAMHEGRVLLSPDELAEACGGTWENLPPDLYINNIRHVYRNTSADDLFVVHYDDWYLYKKSNVSEIPILIKQKNIRVW